jgi:ribose 5-phosphate isomerase B
MTSTNESAGWRIVVGADDAGVDYKDALAERLRADPRVSQVIDVGIRVGEHTPYPDVATAAAQRIASGEADRGLLVCGTGLGMAISANKTPGIRAVTAHDPYSVVRSVLSNNAQVLAFGQRVIGLELAKTLIDAWLDVRFDEQSPSAAKIARISEHERSLIQR